MTKNHVTITSNNWFNNFVAPTNCKDAGLQEDQIKQDLRMASNINLMWKYDCTSHWTRFSMYILLRKWKILKTLYKEHIQHESFGNEFL